MKSDDLFFVDKGSNCCISYAELLAKLSKKEIYNPKKQQAKVEDVFIHILRGFLTDSNFLLWDMDFSEKEKQAYSVEETKNSKECNFEFNSVNELLTNLRQSKGTLNIFTSGTTGKPKVISHNIDIFLRFIRIGDQYKENTWGFAYNPTHMAGLQVFFQALFNKNLIVNIFEAKRKDAINLINEYQISHISATPTFFRLLLPIYENLSSVRRITLGGEKSDESLYMQLKEAFPVAKINNIYATTEFGSLLISKGEYFEVPDKIKDLVLCKEGALFVHRSLLSENDSSQDEWYDTGDKIDVVSKDPLRIKILGRTTNIINIGGNKVDPKEVEEIINGHEDVQIASVYSRPNSLVGNILVAEVVLHNSKSMKEKDMRIFLSDKVQDHKLPRIIKFKDSIELTRTGKVCSK